MNKFTFIDLFAGIGGMRIPFDELGGKCTFSSELDKYAKKTYQSFFDEEPHGDIYDVDIKTINNTETAKIKRNLYIKMD